MLNMLISILGDSYDLFMVERSIIDYREKIEVVLEFQTTFFWRKSRNLKQFVHALASPFEDEENSDDWQGRIVFSEKKQERRIEELFIKLDQVQENIKDKVMESQKSTSNEAASQKDLQTEQTNRRIDEINERLAGLESQIGKIISLFKSK